MEEKINKLYKLEKETRNLQEEVIKDFINKAINTIILEFLEELSDNQYDVPRITDLLSSIEEKQIYTLDIGTTVSKNFDEQFNYYYSTDYDEYAICKLIFTVNNDTIENIEYYTEQGY